MSQSLLKRTIIILGIATALIHLYLNVRLGKLDIPFTLNGLGYLTLTAAFAGLLPMLAGREKLLHYVYMAFTVVTIVGWLVLGNRSDVLGIIDKVIEFILLGALWLHLRRISA